MNKTIKAIIIKNGLKPLFWAVTQEREDHMIIRNKITGEHKFLWK